MILNRIVLNTAMTFAMLCATFTSIENRACAQSDPTDSPPPSHDVKLDIDSGSLSNDTDEVQLVWSHSINVQDAKWTRLHFDSLLLTEGEKHNSVLKMTSLRDGAFQILKQETAQQWRNTSAYFNGNQILVQLFAHPNSKHNQVSIGMATAGEAPGPPPETICDGIDERELSKDVRIGRTSGGCTAWLFNDRPNCMITAGHCADSTDVVFFNVPISNPDGSLNFPPPEDQYSVDADSVQAMANGPGADWCYFGCFNNSNTGLSPLAAQGNSLQLVLPNAPGKNDQIRITGFGLTSAPVSPTFNGAQKTHVGPYEELDGTTLRYRTDTTGGNSGSPVILEGTGEAIGVHGQGGCGSQNNGANRGTGFSNPDWQNAINNPLGICAATQTQLGDVNCDGAVDLLDVGPFVDLLINGEFLDKADINLDGEVNLLDVGPFVALISG